MSVTCRYRVLLIGIDSYRSTPLAGCVNDIDAFERLLVERAHVPRECIQRLASPARHPMSAAVCATSATLENIRTALTVIAQDARVDERVLVYYSGHGARAQSVGVGGERSYREALLPVDFDDDPSNPRLLFDHELNALIATIAARTRSAALVLDCCYAAGGTRDPDEYRGAVRGLGLDLMARLAVAEVSAPLGHGRAGDVQVIGACLDHERAREMPDASGMVRGVLSEALLHVLREVPDGELHTVTWSEVWQDVRARVARRSPHQHVWMAGNPGRCVLAGPPVDGDPGLPIRCVDGDYEIGAGILASVTRHALVAVYGDRPTRFSPLGSAADEAERCGLVRVNAADLSRSTARVEGAGFDLPTGARGRLVGLGEAVRLRCRVVPPDAAIVDRLRASPLVEVVDGDEQVRLLQTPDGRWLVADDIHPADPDRALVVLGPVDVRQVRPVLEHYTRYAAPMRMAEAATDLPGTLIVSVLRCRKPLSPDQGQGAALPEAPSPRPSTYALRQGDLFCLRVHNTASQELRVALVAAEASGRVNLLGNLVVTPGSSHTFWHGETAGLPFVATLDPGRSEEIDRIAAIGTADLTVDLGHLRVADRFVDILAPRRGAKDVVPGTTEAPVIVPTWTASQLIVWTSR